MFLELNMNKKILLISCIITFSAFASDNYLFDTITELYNDNTNRQANTDTFVSLLQTAIDKPNLFSPEQLTTLQTYKTALTQPAGGTSTSTGTSTETPQYATATEAITAIDNALKQANVVDKLAGFNNIITTLANATNASFMTAPNTLADLQAKVTKELFNLYGTRIKTDATALDKLTALIQAAVNSTLITESNKTYFKSTVLPQIANDKNVIASSLATAQLNTDTQAAIAKAIAQTKYANKISGLQTVVTGAKGKKFVAKTQNAYASALTNLYNKRATIKKENAVLKAKFLTLLNASKTTPLLTTAQQNTVKKWIPVVQKL